MSTIIVIGVSAGVFAVVGLLIGAFFGLKIMLFSLVPLLFVPVFALVWQGAGVGAILGTALLLTFLYEGSYLAGLAFFSRTPR